MGSHLLQWISIPTELLGGLAVLLGALVTLTSVPILDSFFDRRKRSDFGFL